MQQQTYWLSMGQRKMTRISMESTRNAATDLLAVNGSETDDQGQHGVHQECSNRLTSCQWVREMTRVSMESTRNAATDLQTVNGSETYDQGQHVAHQKCS